MLLVIHHIAQSDFSRLREETPVTCIFLALLLIVLLVSRMIITAFNTQV